MFPAHGSLFVLFVNRTKILAEVISCGHIHKIFSVGLKYPFDSICYLIKYTHSTDDII